jgi:hypothetical protein
MHKPPLSVGWKFKASTKGSETLMDIPFTTTGNYSTDYSRDVTKAISGFTLMPNDRAKLDLSSITVKAYLILDDVTYPMSEFVFTEDIVQKGVVLDPDTNETADITMVSLGDLTTLLLRNDGNPQTLYKGFSPVAEMIKISQIPNVFGISAEAEESADTEDITWDGTTTDLAKIRQLAELAGHLNPWFDNYGVVRSVSASRVFGEILEFEKDIFIGEAGSVTVTNNYLTVPNRVVVVSNSSADYAIRGQWDAPASWPSSEAKRGYVRTQIQDVQGVQSAADAETIAATIGRRLSARHLTAKIWPTHLLDGPRTIHYDGAYWVVKSWSVDTSPGSLMSIEAEEYFMDDVTQVSALYTQGIL